MVIPADVGLFLVLLLPLMMGAGAMLWAHATAAGSRQHALGLQLSIGMGTTIAALLLAREGPVAALTASQIILCAMAVLASYVMAAPLLDRARHGGLVLACMAGGIGSVFGILHAQVWLPSLYRSGLLLVLIATVTITALIGSAMLPRHPARWTSQARPRLSPLTQGWMLAGCSLLALLLAGLGWLLEPAATPLSQVPLAIAALSGGWAALWLARQNQTSYPLFSCGQGLVAGTLLALLLPLTPLQAALAGLAAALLAARGASLALALKLDDPANHMGMLLCPAVAGLLLHGAYEWAITSLVLGTALSVLWPMAMLLLGLRPGNRQLRAGLDSQG